MGNRITKSTGADSAGAGPQWNGPAMVEGRNAGTGWAADWIRDLSLWLGQGFIDRFEPPLPEQLETCCL